MTEPTQTELRTWARAQGITVKDRGSLPLAVREAYLEAHAAPAATEVRADEDPVQLPSRQDDSSRDTGPIDGPEPVAAHEGSSASSSAGHSSADRRPSADLAGDLREFLVSIDAEIDAVSSLSDRIDARVSELNELRAEQAARLLALDELRESVTEGSLSAFLTKVIKPRAPRVVELVPERLQ